MHKNKPFLWTLCLTHMSIMGAHYAAIQEQFIWTFSLSPAIKTFTLLNCGKHDLQNRKKDRFRPLSLKRHLLMMLLVISFITIIKDNDEIDLKKKKKKKREV